VKHGTLLVFEGLDGSGKSTQLRRLAARLRAAGHDVVETAEPYEGGSWGKRIREMARSGRPLAPREELRWFLEQRREHVRDVVGPALGDGRIVLSDRYFLSTAAYQGARGLDREEIVRRSEAEFPVPDVVILLELAAEEGLGRLAERPGHREPVFERRGFQERVAVEFAALERPYLVRVPASAPADEVERSVLGALASHAPSLNL
jgi:dTMP kinase